MASVWVPFTSESKEAIADYDEIRKEVKLALQECGRRLGVFLRRRERAKGELRRRNIFDLYIEEIVEACSRLKGAKLSKEKLRAQLLKIAMKRTGGARTGEILGQDGSGPEGLPHSIIVTAEGAEGEAPSPVGDEPSDDTAQSPGPEVEPAAEARAPSSARRKPRTGSTRAAKTSKAKAGAAKRTKR
jgi:DNA topoisomerase-6 subunit B